MECTICKQIKQPTKENKTSYINCDSCKDIICLDCSELSATEVRCFTLQRRILKYHCKKCRKFEIVEVLQNTVEDKNEIIKLLQEKIDSLEKNTKPSYGTVLKQVTPATLPIKKNLPEIIVKPKQHNSSNQTKKDVNKNINPAELKVGIANIKTTATGNMIITCQSKNESEILKLALDRKIKNEYCIDLVKLRQPRIKIVNVNGNYNNEEFEKSLKIQNHIDDEVEVKYVRKNKNGTKTFFCECTPKAFHQLMNYKKVCIGWEMYMVYEDLNIPKCYKCQEYYHKKSICKNKIVCPICSEEHEEKDCSKKEKFCRNCSESNKKYKTNHATDHENYSMDCPTLKHHIERLRNKTNYVE